MNLERFIEISNLLSENEVNKTKLFAFYHLKINGIEEFDNTHIKKWFSESNLPVPNLSRLKNKIIANRMFIRGSSEGKYKLHINTIKMLEKEYQLLCVKNEEIISFDTIIPSSLYLGTRGFIENISKQINASFENNIFDGCAVLMRRLLEILLILTYERLQIENEIKDSNGDYVMLEYIIGNTKNNSILNLSRNSKKIIEVFRVLGNFAAHKIYFNCKRADIEKVALEYRALIEELLYKSGLKK